MSGSDTAQTQDSPDTSTPKAPKPRPLSPHLQVYKPQVTSVTSILHRMTGVALAIGLLLLTWGLVALASGAESYTIFTDFMSGLLGRIAMFGWTFAFFYHLCSGVRHFIMDTGAMMDIKSAYKTAYYVYGASILLTLGTWVLYYMCRDVVPVDAADTGLIIGGAAMEQQ